MEEKLITLHSSIAEIVPEDFTHPGLRIVKFIFTDDKPNENGQGIEREDFAEIMKTAIGSPIKMKFLGETVAGHTGSIPIGFIKNMVERETEDGIHQLVADAIIFASEFPEETEYLETKYAEGKAPGISWEMAYKSSIIKDGIEWLKGLVTRAATFVRHPAYGSRTAILALASDKSISDDQFKEAFTELFKEQESQNTEQGGNNSMDEKELQELKDKIASLEITVAEKDAEIERLAGENTTLSTTVAERDTEISEFKQRELVSARTAALSEAGITLPTDPEKLAAKQAFYTSLSEEAFTEYVTDMKEALAANAPKEPTEKKEVFASLRQPERLPRFRAEAGSDEGDEPVTAVGLMSKFKNISRSPARAESE